MTASHWSWRALLKNSKVQIPFTLLLEPSLSCDAEISPVQLDAHCRTVAAPLAVSSPSPPLLVFSTCLVSVTVCWAPCLARGWVQGLTQPLCWAASARMPCELHSEEMPLESLGTIRKSCLSQMCLRTLHEHHHRHPAAEEELSTAQWWEVPGWLLQVMLEQPADLLQWTERPKGRPWTAPTGISVEPLALNPRRSPQDLCHKWRGSDRRFWLAWKTECPGGVSLMYTNTWEENANKIELDPSQLHAVAGKEPMGTDWIKSLPLKSRKLFFPVRVTKHRHRLPRNVVEPLSLETFFKWWQVASSCSWVIRRLGLDDLQRSPPASARQCFCGGVLSCPNQEVSVTVLWNFTVF